MTDGSEAGDFESADPVRLGFVCVRNAGRSQMATAFAERERDRRDVGNRVEIVAGGTDPADGVHDVVVEAMAEVGIDVSGREPRAIRDAELAACDYVATMGCSTLRIDPAADVEVRDWALPDPGGQDLAPVREIRDAVETKVTALFDEIGAEPTA